MKSLSDYISQVQLEESTINPSIEMVEGVEEGESGLTVDQLNVGDSVTLNHGVGRLAKGCVLTVTEINDYHATMKTAAGAEFKFSTNGLRLCTKNVEPQTEATEPKQNQSQDFKDDVSAKDDNGQAYDQAYIDRLKRVAGLK